MTHRDGLIKYCKEQLDYFSNLKNPSPRTNKSIAYYTELLQKFLKEEEKEMGLHSRLTLKDGKLVKR
jgi:hypothetical protein